MTKIHRDKGNCPKCDSDAIRYKQGRRVKAKGYANCGHYIKKS